MKVDQRVLKVVKGYMEKLTRPGKRSERLQANDENDARSDGPFQGSRDENQTDLSLPDARR